MWLLASNICHRRHYVTHFLPDRWPYGTERLSEWVNWIRRGRVANELPARANWVQFVSIIAHSRSGCVNGRSVGGGQTINIVSVLFILCKFLFIVRLMLRLFVFVVKFFFFFYCHCDIVIAAPTRRRDTNGRIPRSSSIDSMVDAVWNETPRTSLTTPTLPVPQPTTTPQYLQINYGNTGSNSRRESLLSPSAGRRSKQHRSIAGE